MPTRSTSSGRVATTMAELMAKKQPSIKSFKKGENVTGVITKLTSSEILVDIGAKTEAVVLEKDKTILRSLLESLKEGDKVSVYVLNSESDQGNPVVSLRGFIDEKLWVRLDQLKNDATVLKVLVTNLTKGGFLVTTDDGFSGFLPNSQTILNDSPQSFVGKKIDVLVLELNRALHKIIFSQKAAMGDEDFQTASDAVKTGEIVDAVVSSTTPFGIFVSIGDPSAGHSTLRDEPSSSDSKSSGQRLEGFIHLSELSWEKTETAENYFKTGEKIKAQVLGIDKDAKRVNLSIKRMSKDPFEENVKQYSIDKKVRGIVKQIGSIGIILDLTEGIEGLIKKDKIPPSSKYSVGEGVEATVTEIDIKRHRIILSPVLKEKPIGYR